jgi:drug/metabolite transporter (DMT)-like permease
LPALPAPGNSRVASGYALVLATAGFGGLNGSIARYLLDDGLSPWRLTQLRTAIAAFAVGVGVAVYRFELLRIDRTALPTMARLAIAMTAAQAGHFYAIGRLEIGVAFAIEYLYPLIILVWLHFGHGRRLGRPMWIAVAAGIVGGYLVVGAYQTGGVDAAGVGGALVGAAGFGYYMVTSERAGDRYEATTSLFWALVLSSLFWTLALPWWSFPGHFLTLDANPLAVLWVALMGTVLPFFALNLALQRIAAVRVAMLMTAEMVFGTLFAYLIHRETLAAPQLLGGAIILAAIISLQLQRPDFAAEASPRGYVP